MSFTSFAFSSSATSTSPFNLLMSRSLALTHARTFQSLQVAGVQLTFVRAASGHASRAAKRGDVQRRVDSVAAREREREPGGEAVAGAVRVARPARQPHRRPHAVATLGAGPAAALRSSGRDDVTRRRIDRTVGLRLVAARADDSVEL